MFSNRSPRSNRYRSPAALCGVLVLAALGACTQAPQARFGAGLPTVAATPEIRTQERRMFERLNRDRAGQSKRPLVYDERLADTARSHSADMRDHGFFLHESPTTGTPQNRLDAAGYLFLTARENLAQAGDVDEAEDDLLKSPHHYENIMADDVTHVGIGIVRKETTPPVLLFTQLFARPGKAETPAAARQSVAHAIQQARRTHKLGTLAEQPKLSELAQQEIGKMPDEPKERDLLKIRDSIGSRLAKAAPGLRGVAVSGQVLPDSTQFQVSPALLNASARSYGLAVEKSEKTGARPLLRVLVLVGL